MRTISLLCLMAILAGCATLSTAPCEYLDEQTAATITVVADPWIFTRKNAPPQLDLFNLYALDVNRMGDHKKYFVVVHYWPADDMKAATPQLVLRGGQEIKLSAISQDARSLGISQPIDKAAPPLSRTWFYPIDKESLQTIARNRQLAASLVSTTATAEYAVWRDGSSQLSEFAVAFDR